MEWLPAPYRPSAATPLPVTHAQATGDLAALRSDPSAIVLYAGVLWVAPQAGATLAGAGYATGSGTDLRCASDGGFEAHMALLNLAAHYAEQGRLAVIGERWGKAGEAYESSAQAVELALAVYARHRGDHWPLLEPGGSDAAAVMRARSDILRLHGHQCAMAHLHKGGTDMADLVGPMRALAVQYVVKSQDGTSLRDYCQAQAALWMAHAALAASRASGTKNKSALAKETAVEAVRAAGKGILASVAAKLQQEAVQHAKEAARRRTETRRMLTEVDSEDEVDDRALASADGSALPPVTLPQPVRALLESKGRAWLLSHPTGAPQPTAAVVEGVHESLLPELLGSAALAKALLSTTLLPTADVWEAVALRAALVVEVRRREHGNDTRASPAGTVDAREILASSERVLRDKLGIK